VLVVIRARKNKEKENMEGIILINPYDDSPTQARKIDRMSEEFEALGVSVKVMKNDGFYTRVENGKVCCKLKTDFVLYFDKDKYTAEMLEQSGIRVFNKALATAVCDDKMQTHIELAKCGVDTPDTLSGTLCYKSEGKISDEYVKKAIDVLGLPLVVKECYGSFGEQVYLASSADELFKIVGAIKNKAYLFQKFHSESFGKDMRVIVIGGKVFCGMMRTSAGDFRSNSELGGNAEAVNVPENIRNLCERAAIALDLDYCGVDVLLGRKPCVCEVNSNAMFYHMERVTGKNVAKAYAEHIISCVRKGINC